MAKRTVKQELVTYLLAILNANDYNILFNAAIFIQRTVGNVEKYEIIEHPTFNTVSIKEYIPCMFTLTPNELLIVGRDANSWDISLDFGLTALNQYDPYLQKQLNAIEKFRTESNKYPIGEINVKDVLYQKYDANDNTGEVPLAWEANTEYTILANIIEFSDDLGYTLIDGFQINAAAVIIQPGTTGIQKIAFTTGSNPTEAHKQFLTAGGIDGSVTIRAAIVLGDETGLSDLDALNIIENKSPTLVNLLDNRDDYANWTNKNFETVYTTLLYRFKYKVDDLITIGPIQVQDARQRILASISIPMESGINLVFGEEEYWELKAEAMDNYFTLTNLTEKNFNEIPTYKPVHFYNDKVASNFVESAANRGSFTLLYDPTNALHIDLYERRLGTNLPTGKYDLRINKPYPGSTPLDVKVLMQVTATTNVGDKIFLTGIINNAKQ